MGCGDRENRKNFSGDRFGVDAELKGAGLEKAVGVRQSPRRDAGGGAGLAVTASRLVVPRLTADSRMAAVVIAAPKGRAIISAEE